MCLGSSFQISTESHSAKGKEKAVCERERKKNVYFTKILSAHLGHVYKDIPECSLSL